MPDLLTTQIEYRPLLPSGPDGIEYQPVSKSLAKIGCEIYSFV